MQDFETPLADPRNIASAAADDDDESTAQTPSPRPQREGLPPGYRMRAERHYVDSITSASGGVPIRLIPIGQFEPVVHDVASPLDALIKSVGVHGILQPLLVRKRQARYEVIAGKRRFAAAMALGLADVPCVLHQVDDAAAAALTAAENLRATSAGTTLRTTVGAQIAEAIGRIADDVSRIQSSLAVLRSAPDGFQRAVTADLLEAQASRTLWLANTAALLATGKTRKGQRRLLSAIVDDVVRQFEAECRLAGLRFEIANRAPAAMVDDSFLTIALSSAVLLTLSLLEQMPQPVVEITARTLEDGGLAAEVVQRHVAASQDMIDRFATHTRSPWTPMIFALGAMALEHATAAHGGAADLVPLDDGGGTAVQLTFCRL